MTGAGGSWIARDGALERTFTFPNWLEALAFVNRISPLAEAANHHPDVELGWGRVRVRLTTHDAGHAVTAKDHALAAQIDAVVAGERERAG